MSQQQQEEVDFSKLSKREILDYCSKSEVYMNRFAELFCQQINDDITSFFNNHDGIKEAYIYVVFDDETEVFNFRIDEKQDANEDTLCIHLVID